MPNSSSIRVLLAEDHTIVRQGLSALLSGQTDMEIIGEASDGRTAVRESVRLSPDVVVMDLGMPDLNGVDATRQIVDQSPSTRILVLSMHSGEEYVRPALRAGASGYLLKGSGLSDFIAAIRAVAGGDAFFSPGIAKILLHQARRSETKPEQTSATAVLTGREREILQLVAEGKSSPEIARTLHLSVKTIEGHRSRIMAKLDVRHVAGLVRYAIRMGLVSADA